MENLVATPRMKHYEMCDFILKYLYLRFLMVFFPGTFTGARPTQLALSWQLAGIPKIVTNVFIVSCLVAMLASCNLLILGMLANGLINNK